MGSPMAQLPTTIILAELGTKFDGAASPSLQPFGHYETLLEATVARVCASDPGLVVVCYPDTAHGVLPARLERYPVRLVGCPTGSPFQSALHALQTCKREYGVIVDGR